MAASDAAAILPREDYTAGDEDKFEFMSGGEPMGSMMGGNFAIFAGLRISRSWGSKGAHE